MIQIHWAWLVLATMGGAFVGLLAASLCCAAGRESEYEEHIVEWQKLEPDGGIPGLGIIRFRPADGEGGITDG